MKIIDFALPVEPFIMGSDISRYPVTRENRKKMIPVLNRNGEYQGIIEPSVFSLMQARMVPTKDEVIFLYINKEVPCIAEEEWQPHMLEAIFKIGPHEYKALPLTRGVEWLTQNQIAQSPTLSPEETQENFEEMFKELEEVFNSSYDGMFLTDGEGKVLRINSSYERLSGLEASSLLGRKMADLVAEGYLDKSVTLQVLETKERVSIIQNIKGNRLMLSTGNPIFDPEGNLYRILTNVRDVTELHELQEQLKETTEEKKRYEQELSLLREMALEDDFTFRSASMSYLVQSAAKVASVDSTVLITGESGTGKEVLAKVIHKKGKGNHAPFIKINCAAVPEALLESELFGYEGGAFTGAKKEGKQGLFELADQGTLFLDEIGDMPLQLQSKLLRALEDREFRRVGGVKSIQIKTRIIAATNQDLEKQIKEGKFREDLYYRLAVVPFVMPPLRERSEDIPLLAIGFTQKFSEQFGTEKSLDPEVVEKLVQYEWPGNVRELSNVVEQMVVMSDQKKITPEYLPDRIQARHFTPKKGTKMKEAVAQTEAYLIRETYKEYQSWTKTAEALGMDRVSIYRKAKKYGISVGD
jgi:PAS domain S-box-containing protein